MIRTEYKLYQVSHSGFTLIEMMIVLVIIAIFTAIAIPSYRQYTVRNAESQALVKMKQTELELARWRASALTYKGFFPTRLDNTGNITYAYADSSINTAIYVPDNADSSTAKYKIQLTSDSAGVNTLAISLSSISSTNLTLGNTWYMYAVPNSSLTSYGAKKILLSSNGLGCKSSASSFNATSTCNTSDVVSLDK